MNTPVTQLLAQLSDALAAHVAAAAALVTAIRIGPNRLISGIVWRADVVVTSDQALPAQDSYSLTVVGGQLVPARASRRDPVTNLVCLNLDTPAVNAPIRPATDPAAGALALALGAAADGSPTVRLAAIHRIAHGYINGTGSLGDSIMLDLAGTLTPEGGPVLDARGGLLGMASAGPNGEALVIPYTTIARFLEPLGMVKALPSAHRAHRGWLGARLSRSQCRKRCGRSRARRPGGWWLASPPADRPSMRDCGWATCCWRSTGRASAGSMGCATSSAPSGSAPPSRSG